MHRKPDRLFARYVRTGDPSALAAVFDATSPEILRVALHLGGDAAEAEDLLQATFVTAIERAASFDPSRPVRPWLLGILGNHARRAREKRRAVALPPFDAAAPGAGPPDVAEAAEIEDEVTRAIDTLPEPYRRAMLLSVKHGLAAVEIAHLLDVPPPTVRSWIRRGQEKLRRRLPRGLVASLVVGLPEVRGLAAVRDSVLARVPPAAALPGAAATVAGGALAMKKIVVAAVAVLILLAGGFAVFGPGADKPPDPPRDTPPPLPEFSAADEPEASAEAAPHVIDRERDLHGVVVDAAGEPIPGARLTAIGRPWTRFRQGAPITEVPGPEAVTDARGEFALRLERGQTVHLRVRADGYPAKTIRGLSAGERVRVVLPAAVALTVRVETDSGEPIPGARVRVWSWSRRTGVARPELLATTGRAGRCRFEGLLGGESPRVDVAHPRFAHPRKRGLFPELPAEGEHEVVVRLPEGTAVSGRVVDAADGAPIARAEVADSFDRLGAVTTDDEGRFEIVTSEPIGALYVRAEGYATGFFVSREPGPHEIALHRGDTVTGRVVDVEGRVVPGARVLATGSGGYGFRDPRVTVTDEKGRFSIAHLNRLVRSDLGPHILVVAADGHGRVVTDFDPSPTPGGTIDVGDVVLPPAQAIAGRVLDAAGEPVARASVVLEGANDDRGRLRPDAGPAGPGSLIREGRYTDDLGRFLFPDLSPGDYRLRVSASGLRFPEVDVSLPPGRARVDVEVRHPAIVAPLTVRVRDESGSPVAGVTVMGFVDGGLTGKETDSAGEVVFRHSGRTARLSVRTRASGEGALYAEAAGKTAGPREMEVTFVLTPLSPIEGVVVDEAGRAVPDLKLRVERTGAYVAGAATDAVGRFRIGVPAGGPVDVLTTDASYAGKLEAVRAGADDLRLVVRRAGTGGSLAILALDPEGEPLPRVPIRISPGTAPDTVTTGPDGRADATDLPDRELTISVPRWKALGETCPPRPVKVVPNGQLLELRFRRGREIAGLVRRPEGVELRMLLFEVREDDRFLHSGSVGADGRFVTVVPAERAGRLLVCVAGAARGGNPYVAEAEVEPSATGIELTLAPRK